MNQLQDFWLFPKAFFTITPVCSRYHCDHGKMGIGSTQCALAMPWSLFSDATIFDVPTASAKPLCTIKPIELPPPGLHLIGTRKMKINCPNSMTHICAAGLLKATFSRALHQWQLQFLCSGSERSWWPSGGQRVRWSEGENVVRNSQSALIWLQFMALYWWSFTSPDKWLTLNFQIAQRKQH